MCVCLTYMYYLMIFFSTIYITCIIYMAFGWSLLGSETVILSQEVSLITCEFNRIWRVKNNFWNGSLLLFLTLVVIYYLYFLYIFFLIEISIHCNTQKVRMARKDPQSGCLNSESERCSFTERVIEWPKFLGYSILFMLSFMLLLFYDYFVFIWDIGDPSCEQEKSGNC